MLGLPITLKVAAVLGSYRQQHALSSSSSTGSQPWYSKLPGHSISITSTYKALLSQYDTSPGRGQVRADASLVLMCVLLPMQPTVSRA